MAAFACSSDQARKILEGCAGVTLANINAPAQCVVSGQTERVKAAIECARTAGVQAKEIAVSQAFHCDRMLHAQAPLRAALEQLKITSPSIPVFSNLDGQPYRTDAAAVVDCLVDHIVRPVDFVAEVENMQAAGATIFLEVDRERYCPD